jgi:hypothetical protein
MSNPSTGSRRTVPLPRGWEAIRATVLARDPVCRWGTLPEDMAEPGMCQARSTDADHTGDPSDHRLEMLRGLCPRHHAIRTGRQGAAAWNASRPTRRRPPEQHPAYRKGMS